MLLLKIFKQDGDYKITGTKEYEIDVNYHEDFYRETTQDVFDFVNAEIDENDLTFPDTPGIPSPSIQQITLTPVDAVEKLKGNALHFLRFGELEKSLDSDFYLTFLEFIQLNNYLCSKGHFVTDENREEVYLDILNSGDAVLIEKLEDYLEIMDEISRFDGPIQDYRDSRKSLKDMSTTEEIRTFFRNKTGREIADLFNGNGNN